jgi:hypothetical protein
MPLDKVSSWRRVMGSRCGSERHSVMVSDTFSSSVSMRSCTAAAAITPEKLLVPECSGKARSAAPTPT